MPDATAADRPHVLLITTDQHHWQAMGTRTPLLKTPHLDRLAGEGVTVDRAYCPNPLCTPSRASILTGQYPSTHGAWTLGTKLDESATTVSGLLSEAGYATSLIGKAHLQPLASIPSQTSIETPAHFRDWDLWRSFHGPFYGFDHIEITRNHADEQWVGAHYALWMEESGFTDWPDYFRHLDGTGGREHHWDLPAEQHYTTWTAERTVAQLEAAAASGQPSFCWASFHDPHPPYLVPEPWASLYDPDDCDPGVLVPGELDQMHPWFGETQRDEPDFSPWFETPYETHGFGRQVVDRATMQKNLAIYYGMISFLDDQIGRILTRLDELGLAENTLVVFSTDHGHFLGAHGLTAKGPFHYEDLIRIPFLARWPGRIPAGSSTSAITSLVDLAPTFLSAAGVAVPGSMQGVDQLDAWAGGPAARDHAITENRFQPSTVHIRTYVEDRYKLTVYRDEQHAELFDLHDDPDELHNLAHDPAHAALRAEITRRFLDAELRREASNQVRVSNA